MRVRGDLLLAVALVICAACGKANPSSSRVQPLPEGLRQAPTTVTVQGLTLSLSASLYRDFMMQPPGSEGGSPLVAILVVSTADKRPLLDDVRVERAWIMNGEEVWEPSRLDEKDRKESGFRHEHGGDIHQPPNACEVTAHGGPKWRPGIDVEVVVELRDKSRERYLLRQPAVRIVGLGD